MKRYVYMLIGASAIIFVSLCFRPVPIPAEKDCLSLKGTVVDIYEGGTKDIVFKLKGNNKTFYINRGLERGLKLEELKANLRGEEILIKYPDHWTLLDPSGTNIHISKIEHSGKTVFTELD